MNTYSYEWHKVRRSVLNGYENVLLLIGLVRTKRYVELMGRYERLSHQYERAMAVGVGVHIPVH